VSIWVDVVELALVECREELLAAHA